MTDHNAEADIDWSQPCPKALRCPDQNLCPLACRRAGNREGNKADEGADR